MKLYIAIDDTDSLEVGATGQSANEMRRIIKDKGWGSTEPVTRHQLLIHPDVPYTSHNSSMCFIAEIEEDKLDQFIDYAADFLKETSAPGSDPGLCVAVSENIKNLDKLMSFGVRAKKQVLSKEEAYQTARECNVHLSEHGGTGQGVIGALAGLSLRLTGNDGRFQGRTNLKATGEIMKVEEIIAGTEIEEIQSVDGQVLALDEKLVVGEKIKTVLLDNKRKLLVYWENNQWHTCTNKHLEKY
ncbi:MAG TPA: hypothetical protein VHQ70_09325 [Syntrophomonadaceae bacterium]|nr:hypothetical protein [Syntrophomonadaceae bacterium]